VHFVLILKWESSSMSRLNVSISVSAFGFRISNRVWVFFYSRLFKANIAGISFWHPSANMSGIF